MLDQDTARAVLTVVDERRVRVALLGDRHQLSAVGRGGVLDIAARCVDPAAHVTLDGVHRFTRTTVGPDGTPAQVPDGEYADLTLAMRTGDDPGAVFDALTARGQLRVRRTDAGRQDAVARIAAAGHTSTDATAVVAATREQVAQLNTAIRDRLVTAGVVDDSAGTATTAGGQRIGVGDLVATRRNDRDLDVANRDIWTVIHADRHGGLTVTGERGRRRLPAAYVAAHVELAYATTVHGVQGDTVTSAHVVIGEHTGAAAAYVGMTRGRRDNTAHLVADTVTDAREQWVAVFIRDRADLGAAHAAQVAAHEASQYETPRPLGVVLAELREAWTVEHYCLDRLAWDEPRRDALRGIVSLRQARAARMPALEAAYAEAGAAADDATEQARRTERIVAGAAGRVAEALLAEWVRQRGPAYQAAQTVTTGGGRFGRHRAAVRHARQDLSDWTDAWRPYLPDLPADTDALVDYATRTDNRAALMAAFDGHARRATEQVHPEHAAARAAADTAITNRDQARDDLRETTRYYQLALAHYGNLARTQDPERQLTHLDAAVTATRARLDATRDTLTALHREPALRSQPADRVTTERAAWHHQRDVDKTLSDAAHERTDARPPRVQHPEPRTPNRHPDQESGDNHLPRRPTGGSSHEAVTIPR